MQNVKALKDFARGRWDAIFRSLAPQLGEAMDANGSHVPSPVSGGKDRFRLFSDWKETGGSVSNAEGTFTDGLATLMYVNGWNFGEAVKQLARFLDPNNGNTEVVNADHQPEIGVVQILKTVTIKGKEVFCLELLKEDGLVATFWGKRIRAEVARKGVKVGSRISIHHFADSVRNLSGGRQYRTALWRLEVLLTPQEIERIKAQELKERLELTESIQKMWKESKKPTLGSPVWNYLKSRGLNPRSSSIQNNIRESVSFASGKEWPVMLAEVRDRSGKLITLHRTFLTEEGKKAPMENCKRLMKLPKGSSISSSAIGFGNTDESIVGVAEGIETALSIVVATGYPCFAAISANGVVSFQPPTGAKVVLIFADKDASETGQKAAEKARERLASEGYHAIVLLPFEEIPEGVKGIDWNDVLVNNGYFPLKRA